MRTGFLAILVLALLAISSATSIAASSKGGGGSCAACVLIVDLVEKIAVQEAGGSVSKAFDYLCGNFQGSLSWLAGICDSLTGILAIPIQLALEVGEIPDNTCKTGGLAFLKMCTADDAQCQLFHSPVHSRLSHYSAVAPDAKDARIAAHLRMFGALLGERVSTPVVNHRPLVDDDQDAFSTAPTLRGYHWRGRDCNDQDGSVYPGRAVNAEGSSVDHNCNGISGTDPQTQQAYEDELCSGPNQPRGTIIIGDSAAAHFSLPPKYLMPDNQNSSSVYLDLLPLLEDEADYPHCSWSTGFANESTGCPASKLPFNSFYQRMRARNRCNHRDYQNIGVNGARSSNVAPPDGNINAMQRTKNDAPANVFYALIGNDVCSGHHTFDTMTTPADFLLRVTEALKYMNSLLPAGSAVFFAPLVDGRVLYNTLGERTHPVGVKYREIYDYLNCLNTSPCWGWMNSNETVRNLTTAHAESLSAVYQQIIDTQKYDAFTMHALTVDWEKIMHDWIAQGNDGADLIEPTDGFHPSTTGQQLTADVVWTQIQQKWPETLGPINPNNDLIQKLFGNQGGD